MIPAPSDDLDAVIEGMAGLGADFLSPMGPVILAAASCGLAGDSRSFAKVFDLAHALVIRECVSLCDDLGLLEVTEGPDRSQRIFYRLSGQAARAAAMSFEHGGDA